MTLTAFVTNQTAVAASYITQPGTHRPHERAVTPMLGISGYAGVEAGGKLDYLLANPAFIPALNNTVYLEGGVFLATDGGPFVAPQLRWEFHLAREWSVYGEGGLEINLDSDSDGRIASLVTCAGAIWRLPGKSFTIRGEVDAAHGAVRAGPSLPF